MNTSTNRNGIIGGGNLIVDYIKIINYYPNKNMMCEIIQDPKTALGGCPHNVLIDLAKMDTAIPLSALGLIGNDRGGDLILDDFIQNGINTDFIQKTSSANSSFTDCMIEVSTGNRTFFHCQGANALLSYDHFLPVQKSNAKIFHLANLLHLSSLDSFDDEYGLVSAKVLHLLAETGFKTSVDLVSVKSDLFAQVAKYCLKYIHYLIINDYEAECLSGIPIRKDNEIDFDNLKIIGEFLINNGVIELVVIHFPEGGYAVTRNLEAYYEKSYQVPQSEIKSSVGAGDAFCAGMLYSLHENLPIRDGLKIANASAMFNLFHPTATGGAVPLSKIKEFLDIEVNKKILEP